MRVCVGGWPGGGGVTGGNGGGGGVTVTVQRIAMSCFIVLQFLGCRSFFNVLYSGRQLFHVAVLRRPQHKKIQCKSTHTYTNID